MCAECVDKDTIAVDASAPIHIARQVDNPGSKTNKKAVVEAVTATPPFTSDCRNKFKGFLF